MNMVFTTEGNLYTRRVIRSRQASGKLTMTVVDQVVGEKEIKKSSMDYVEDTPPRCMPTVSGRLEFITTRQSVVFWKNILISSNT